MQLRRLAALERQKIIDEYNEVLGVIEDSRRSARRRPGRRDGVIKDELKDVKAKYGDARRTTHFEGRGGRISRRNLIPDEQVVVSMTRRGYVKRIGSDAYKLQHRGGKGIRGMGTRDEDQVDQLFVTRTHDNILFFTNRGRVFQLKVYELPDTSRQAKGTPVINLIQVEQGERVTATLTLSGSQIEGYCHGDEERDHQAHRPHRSSSTCAGVASLPCL